VANPGDTVRVDVVSVAGKTIMILYGGQGDGLAAFIASAEQVLSSLSFEP
jgi:hypothetical protein